ncbi:uncharacterized protein AB675_11818 [Cyphellophora attinorum]|uniref:Uncharacterized protein n=1 Tax=Cyphellophora attinorum TaxID=1664694 RepID=A0A0N0NJF6_9EURO|nr:uncharacterized protein AB675_11818 [Phialophora attinorum]KPI36848.1 hypothetical protein AB675_11818 [Phialophora attinorum]
MQIDWQYIVIELLTYIVFCIVYIWTTVLWLLAKIPLWPYILTGGWWPFRRKTIPEPTSSEHTLPPHALSSSVYHIADTDTTAEETVLKGPFPEHIRAALAEIDYASPHLVHASHFLQKANAWNEVGTWVAAVTGLNPEITKMRKQVLGTIKECKGLLQSWLLTLRETLHCVERRKMKAWGSGLNLEVVSVEDLEEEVWEMKNDVDAWTGVLRGLVQVAREVAASWFTRDSADASAPPDYVASEVEARVARQMALIWTSSLNTVLGDFKVGIDAAAGDSGGFYTFLTLEGDVVPACEVAKFVPRECLPVDWLRRPAAREKPALLSRARWRGVFSR